MGGKKNCDPSEMLSYLSASVMLLVRKKVLYHVSSTYLSCV